MNYGSDQTMLEDQIREIIKRHYSVTNSRLLLLSHLGKVLSDQELWPKAGEKRTLLDVVESVSGVSVIRDEKAEAFIAVVLKGDEPRAEEEILRRHRLFFLKGLPRALIIAFTIPIDEPAKMFVRLSPKLQYRIDTAGNESEIEVNSDLRVPIDKPIELDELEIQEIQRLEVGIRSWADRSGVDLTTLRRNYGTASKISTTSKPASIDKHTSALERLFAAQEPEVAKRMVIPMDIAILLGKH